MKKSALAFLTDRHLANLALDGDGQARAELASRAQLERDRRARHQDSVMRSRVLLCRLALRGDAWAVEQLALATWFPPASAATRTRRSLTPAAIIAGARAFLQDAGALPKDTAPPPSPRPPIDAAAIYAARNGGTQ